MKLLVITNGATAKKFLVEYETGKGGVINKKCHSMILGLGCNELVVPSLKCVTAIRGRVQRGNYKGMSEDDAVRQMKMDIAEHLI